MPPTIDQATQDDISFLPPTIDQATQDDSSFLLPTIGQATQDDSSFLPPTIGQATRLPAGRLNITMYAYNTHNRKEYLIHWMLFTGMTGFDTRNRPYYMHTEDVYSPRKSV